MSVTRRLQKEPHGFDFFQAVRLLHYLAREERSAGRIGSDDAPEQEPVRFKALVSHSFPPNAIHSLSLQDEYKDISLPAAMTVSFMGMTGPSGVLPQHYTQLVIDRIRYKDESLRDFLDLFNHRMISLFYRAWEKHRLPVAYEQGVIDQDEDRFTSSLFSLAGFGTKATRGRLQIDDQALLYYSGLLAHQPRNAVGLESMLADYFELPVQILQFQGQWLYLRHSDQSKLARDRGRHPANNQLGRSVVVGQRIWGVESRFRVQLGPLTYQQFCRFAPSGDALVAICQLIRTYVGAHLDFDIQPVLAAADVPRCQLGGNSAAPSRLGWNTWLCSRPPDQDADDAVFELDGYPLQPGNDS